MKRYTLKIRFTNYPSTPDMVEDFETLRSADFTSVLDDTVKSAVIIDNITGKVKKTLK